MRQQEKTLAIELRKEGCSYSEISRRINISKSTLSDWLKNIPFSPNQETRSRIKLASTKSATTMRAKRVASISKAKSQATKEIGKLTKRDLWLFGTGLYLGEGAKSIESVRIINSNSNVVKLGIAWLNKICEVSLENLTIAIHTHPDINIPKILKYWSLETGIPISQFGKTQIDRRTNKSNSKRNSLPHGTVQIRVRANGNNKLGVYLHRRIMGWIETVTQQINLRD